MKEGRRVVAQRYFINSLGISSLLQHARFVCRRGFCIRSAFGRGQLPWFQPKHVCINVRRTCLRCSADMLSQLAAQSLGTVPWKLGYVPRPPRDVLTSLNSTARLRFDMYPTLLQRPLQKRNKPRLNRGRTFSRKLEHGSQDDLC